MSKLRNLQSRKPVICTLMGLLGMIVTSTLLNVGVAEAVFDECKYCDSSVGVTVCLLADEDEQGFTSCAAGEICFYVNNQEICFQNACQVSNSCLLPPNGF